MAAKMNMPAVAVTDTNNMFCALEFSEGASKAGIQPIIGCQVDLGYTVIEQGKRQEDPAGIVLLAQSEAGYLNLMKLNSCLYLDQGNQVPQVTLDDLQKYNAGLICLTGGPDGPIGRLLRAGQRPAAEALMDRFAAIYPDRLYVELQRHPDGTGLPEAEALSERGFVEMAYAKGLPLGITSTWTAAVAAGTGTMNVTLKHKPGVKAAGDPVSKGETDISIDFKLSVK